MQEMLENVVFQGGKFFCNAFGLGSSVNDFFLIFCLQSYLICTCDFTVFLLTKGEDGHYFLHLVKSATKH